MNRYSTTIPYENLVQKDLYGYRFAGVRSSCLPLFYSRRRRNIGRLLGRDSCPYPSGNNVGGSRTALREKAFSHLLGQ